MSQTHIGLCLIKDLLFTSVISFLLIFSNQIHAQNYNDYSVAFVDNNTIASPLFLDIQRDLISTRNEANYSFISNALSKSVNQTTADPEEIFLYTLNFSCPSTTAGDCENVIISDVLPSEIEFINFPSGCTGCSYDASTHTFTANLGTINNGSTISLDLQVRFPTNVLDGATADNTAVANYDQNNTATTSTSATVSTTATNGIVITYDDMGYVDKSVTSISGATLSGLQGINYGHTFDTDVTNFVMEDVFPAGMFLKGFNVKDIDCAPALLYNMEFLVYDTTANTSSWINAINNPYNTSTFNICSDCFSSPTNNFYTTAADEYIGGIRLTYPNTPGDGCFHPDFPGENPAITLSFAFDETLTGETNPQPGDVIDNCANVVSDNFVSMQDCAGITINQLRHNYTIFKGDQTNTNPYEPGEIVRFSLTFRNSLDGDYDIVNPSMIDILPPEYEYIGNVTTTQSGGVVPNPGSTTLEPTVTSEQDFMGIAGQTKITYDWDDATNNGITIDKNSFDRIIVAYDVRIRVTAADMSSIVNTVYPVEVRDDYNCSTPDTDDIDGDGNTTETICPATESIDILYPPGFAGLNSYKEVQGNLDTDFSRFPANGQVSPNGNIEYNLCLENPLNLPETIDDIVLVDVLPHVGDRGVVANNELRESAWRPTFTSTTLSDLQTYVGGISGATLYFTTECEPCLNADLGARVTDLGTCSTPNWTATAPANLADICAFKIEYGSSFDLSPGEETCLNINLIAPANVPLDSSIAWNSFGFVGNKESGSALLASEPIKVGIASMPFNCMNPTAAVSVIQPSCTNGITNSDGYLELSTVTDGDKLNFSLGNVYTGPTDYADASALTIGALPFQFSTGLSNPNGSQDYTVRVFNGESNCFTDVVITMNERICPQSCDCPVSHSLCWDASGFNEPPNDNDANFPWMDTMTDIDNSGVDLEVTVFQAARGDQESYVSPGQRCGCTFDTELGPYLSCGEVFRNWSDEGAVIDTIIMSFSEPIKLPKWGFGGFKTNRADEDAVAAFTFYDGPNGTGNIVTSTLSSPGGRAQINTGDPLSAAINELQDQGLQETEFYNGTYYYEGQNNTRGWTILDMGDAVIQSIVWTQYTVAAGSSPADYVSIVPTGLINSGYVGTFDFEKCTCTCPEINELITTRSICHGQNVDTLAALTTFENPDSIAFVYFNSIQTDPSIIYADGTGIDTVQISAMSDTVRITNVGGFTNSTTQTNTYYVYAIAHPIPLDVNCRPYEEILVTVNPLPTASATGIDVSCPQASTTPNSDGSISLTGFSATDTYQYSIGNTFDIGNVIPASPTTIPTDGILVNNLTNPSSSQSYTIRITNTSACFIDRTVTLNEITCSSSTDYPDYSSSLRPCPEEPCHIISNDLYLGQNVSADATPTSNEVADSDDDDGIFISPNMQFIPGSTLRVPVSIYNNTTMPAYLRMWIDWNGDGDFEDTGEQIEDNTYPSTGTENIVLIPITIPLNATQVGSIALRARLSTDDTNSATPCGTGTCAADGEIEDYLLQVNCPTPICPPIQLMKKSGNP